MHNEMLGIGIIYMQYIYRPFWIRTTLSELLNCNHSNHFVIYSILTSCSFFWNISFNIICVNWMNERPPVFFILRHWGMSVSSAKYCDVIDFLFVTYNVSFVMQRDWTKYVISTIICSTFSGALNIPLIKADKKLL